jgi:PAS domain S-box-containing protein
VIGTTHNTLLPNDDPKWVQIYGEVALTGKSVHFDNYSPALNRHYEVFAYCPAPHQFAVVFTDVTERKHGEAELRELAQRLNSHMENSPLAVIEWGPDYRIMRWSEEAERVFGWTAEEILGKRMDDVRWVYEEDWPIVAKLTEDMNAGIRPRNVNPNRNYRKDGSIIYCEWYNSVLRDSFGTVTSVLSLVLDVTEREQAEQQLAEARAEAERRAAEMESFVSNLADGVSMIDLEGRIVLMNDTGREIFRVPPEETFSDWMSRYQLFSLDGTPLPPEQSAGCRALRGERVKDFRYMAVTPFGDTIILSSSASPVFDGQGRVVGATSTFRDQGERVAFENEKQHMLDREHHIAEVLQQAIIPSDVPAEMLGYNIAVKYRPALREAEVGGDFYDVFDLGDNKIAILIGDVAGKGLAAAIRVAAARHAIRSYAYIDPRPARVMTLANEALCRDTSDVSKMLTAFLAILDPKVGAFTYSSAGHEPPVFCYARGDCEEMEIGGLPLGLMLGVTYTQSSRRLDPGDIVVMVTDGITEARAPGPIQFGKEGLTEFMMRHRTSSPEEIATQLLEAAIEHAGGELQDDAAVVVFSLAGKADGTQA